MTDFLDALEGELVRAGRRRTDPARPRIAVADDLLAVGRGGLATLSVAVAVTVAAVVIGLAGHRAAVPDTNAASPSAGSSIALASPCRGTAQERGDATLTAWLSAAAPVSATAGRAALRELRRAGAPVAAVDPSDIRRVHLPGVGTVTLIAARRCAPGSSPQLLAEVPVAGGLTTVDLGSAGAIRRGAALAATAVLVPTPRGLQSVSALPAWAARVVCHGPGSTTATRSYPAVDHLVALSASERLDRCRPEVS